MTKDTKQIKVSDRLHRALKLAAAWNGTTIGETIEDIAIHGEGSEMIDILDEYYSQLGGEQ